MFQRERELGVGIVKERKEETTHKKKYKLHERVEPITAGKKPA